MNLRMIPTRIGTSLVVVVGIAGVVGVLVAMLSMGKGFEYTLKGTGSEERAVLMSAGVSSELSSYIGPDIVPLLRELPGVGRAADGRPLASAELMVVTELRRGAGARAPSVNVALRGVEAAGLALRPEVRLSEGRWFQSGLREVVAGRAATRQFAGVGVGAHLRFRGSEWTVVGIFESRGDAHESELWSDADTARSAFGRPGTSCVLVALAAPGALGTLQAAIAADPRFQIEAQTERHYFTAQSQNVTDQINLLTGVVTVIMAFGALFGALNTLYSAVAARQIEIATLRALGFGGAPVMVSVLAEAVALAVLGGSGGALIAWLLFNGMTVSTLGQGFTQVAFSFAVTPGLVARGLLWSVAIGLAGGFFPALHAARVPVADALRAA
jgi:putative ABC transport system permease protein